MKILHIIDSEGLYGAEIMLLNLAEEQYKMGHEPAIASIGKMGNYYKPIEAEAQKRGLQIIKFRMHNGPNVLGAWRILKFARANRYDILHSHGYKGNILLGFIPKHIRKIPLVRTLHGWTSTRRFSKMRLYEWVDVLSLTKVDAVVVVNELMLSHPYLQKLKTMHVDVINNGIPYLLTNCCEQEKEIIDFCKKKFTIISIGRLSKEKGYSNLIHSFARSLKEGVDAQLLLIGEGPERRMIEHLIDLYCIKDRVILAGYKQDAWSYLPYAGVFVLSSLTEGLPITLLEAMKLGIPVIATAVGGIPQLIRDGETGFLVPPDKIDPMSKSIRKLYNEKELGKRMGSQAMELVNHNYTSKRMTQRYISLYERLVSVN